jgi:hypothetical protein
VAHTRTSSLPSNVTPSHRHEPSRTTHQGCTFRGASLLLVRSDRQNADLTKRCKSHQTVSGSACKTRTHGRRGMSAVATTFTDAASNFERSVRSVAKMCAGLFLPKKNSAACKFGKAPDGTALFWRTSTFTQSHLATSATLLLQELVTTTATAAATTCGHDCISSC